MMSREIERIQYFVNNGIVKILNTREESLKLDYKNKLIHYIEISQISLEIKKYFRFCVTNNQISDYFNHNS